MILGSSQLNVICHVTAYYSIQRVVLLGWKGTMLATGRQKYTPSVRHRVVLPTRRVGPDVACGKRDEALTRC